MEQEIKLSNISEAIKAIQNGKIVIVVDDEDRENEGDFVAAAELITPEIINFMSTQGRGLICTPLTDKRCIELGLELMVGRSTDPKETAFTVSIDLIGDGVTTGISAVDRAKTIRALMNSETKPTDLARPGHIFPLKAREGGVLRRAGHTEAAIDLARLSGLKPGGVIVEIMNEDGTMARLADLKNISDKYNLPIISIKDLIQYRLQFDSLIELIDEFDIPTIYGDYLLKIYRQTTNDQIHFALIKGSWQEDDLIPVRVQSSKNYNDFFSSLHFGEEDILKKSSDIINNYGRGAIIFINNISENNSVLNKINHYKDFIKGKQDKPFIPMDKLDIGIGAQILKNIGIKNIQLITKNPKGLNLNGFDLEIKDFLVI